MMQHALALAACLAALAAPALAVPGNVGCSVTKWKMPGSSIMSTSVTQDSSTVRLIDGGTAVACGGMIPQNNALEIDFTAPSGFQYLIEATGCQVSDRGSAQSCTGERTSTASATMSCTGAIGSTVTVVGSWTSGISARFLTSTACTYTIKAGTAPAPTPAPSAASSLMLSSVTVGVCLATVLSVFGSFLRH